MGDADEDDSWEQDGRAYEDDDYRADSLSNHAVQRLGRSQDKRGGAVRKAISAHQLRVDV